MSKKILKKLVLKKKTIADLNEKQMNEVNGGIKTYTCRWSLCPTCNIICTRNTCNPRICL